MSETHARKISAARTGIPHPQNWTIERRKANGDKTRERQIWKNSPVGKGLPPWNKNTADESYKSRMREKRLHQIFPKKTTKIETALQKALTDCEIAFETHKAILGQPDIFIKPNVCIFADGCYWHCCPAHFPIPLNISQEKNYHS